MSETPLPSAAPSRQALRLRILWFLVGAVVNYLIISLPLHWLQRHTQLSVSAMSDCALGLSTSFFFLWNYFVNFRTDARRRDALRRYLIAVLCMWRLSSWLLAYLKGHDFHYGFSLAGFALDLDVITTQFALGGLKFLLYHFWVFPAPKGEKLIVDGG